MVANPCLSQDLYCHSPPSCGQSVSYRSNTTLLLQELLSWTEYEICVQPLFLFTDPHNSKKMSETEATEVPEQAPASEEQKEDTQEEVTAAEGGSEEKGGEEGGSEGKKESESGEAAAEEGKEGAGTEKPPKVSCTPFKLFIIIPFFPLQKTCVIM